MRASRWLDQMGAVSGLGYVVLIMVGNSIATTGQSNDPAGSQVLSDMAKSAKSSTAQLGMTMQLVAFILFGLFLGYLYSRLRAAEGPGGWCAPVAFGGGLLTLAIKLGSGGVEASALINRGDLTPTLAKVLYDVGGAAFVISWLTFAIFLLGAGLAILRSGLLQAWLGWAAVTLAMGNVAAFATAGKTMINGNPAPFLLGLLWTAVVSVTLTVQSGRGRHGAAAEVQAAPALV